MFEAETKNLGKIDRGTPSIEEGFSISRLAGNQVWAGESFETPPVFKIFSISILLVLLAVSARLFNLQINQGGDYSLAAANNSARVLLKPAPRGVITDRWGEVIVRNVPSFELVLTPADLPENPEVLKELVSRLAAIADLSFEEMQAKIEEADDRFIEPVSIKQALSQEEALALEELVSRNPSLAITATPVREYIDGPVFSNLIGYTGKITKPEWEKKRTEGYYFNDSLGKTALESVYETHLRGTHGRTELEVDARGSVVKKTRDTDSVAGKDLQTTIDAGLQRAFYTSLKSMVDSRPSSTGGAGVAMDPKTGEVLALVTYPSYDNNLFARGISAADYAKLIQDKSKPMLNRPISGVYPPGSTLKITLAAAALEEGVVDENTVVVDRGFIQWGSYRFHGWNRSGLGPLSVRDAITRSSDPYFYVVGGGHPDYGLEGLGINRLVDYYSKFHIGRSLGINLPNEERGLLPTPEWKKQRFAGTDEQNWYIGNTYHISIGQGYLLATPLQVAAYAEAVGNNGTIMKPILTTEENPEVIANIPISEKNFNIVKQGMTERLGTGSGSKLMPLGIPIAGKTGTAQFDHNNLAKTHSWYTGFSPIEDPKIVFSVIIENGGEGYAAAVPVVRDMLAEWIKRPHR